MPARVTAVKLLGQIGPPARKDAQTILYQASKGKRGQELIDPATEALKLILKN